MDAIHGVATKSLHQSWKIAFGEFNFWHRLINCESSTMSPNVWCGHLEQFIDVSGEPVYGTPTVNIDNKIIHNDIVPNEIELGTELVQWCLCRARYWQMRSAWIYECWICNIQIWNTFRCHFKNSLKMDWFGIKDK